MSQTWIIFLPQNAPRSKKLQRLVSLFLNVYTRQKLHPTNLIKERALRSGVVTTWEVPSHPNTLSNGPRTISRGRMGGWEDGRMRPSGDELQHPDKEESLTRKLSLGQLLLCKSKVESNCKSLPRKYFWIFIYNLCKKNTIVIKLKKVFSSNFKLCTGYL